MEGFAFNTRRTIFKDRRVREALAIMFDFEWINHNLFDDLYTRTISFFDNSDLASTGKPASAEERTVAAQEQRRLSHVFYCDANEDIQRGDRLTEDGITVEVLGIREPSRARHHLECDCWETQIEGEP